METKDTYKKKLEGSIMRLFDKLYNVEQLYDKELLTSKMKPYPRNEEIEKFMIECVDEAYQIGFSKGYSDSMSVVHYVLKGEKKKKKK